MVTYMLQVHIFGEVNTPERRKTICIKLVWEEPPQNKTEESNTQVIYKST